MQDMSATMRQRTDLQTPIRNRYFFGKLLDAYHFDLETDYFNHHRRRLNRLVSGSGVVCGLNVETGRAPDQIVVGPGLALDRWGREIVVPRRTNPITIPPDILERAIEKANEHQEIPCVAVLICYHEYESDPTPVLAGDCLSTEPCAPGSIHEQYRIVFEGECAPARHPRCHIPDILAGGRLDYAALAKWVTNVRGCSQLSANPCIPLANIRLSQGQTGHCCTSDDVDITVRPIVYTNMVLFELVLALLSYEQSEPVAEYE